MKHMKQIVMGLMLIGLAVAGYMAYQRYYAPQADDVKVQLLNFGTSNGSYEQGYHDGMRDCQNN